MRARTSLTDPLRIAEVPTRAGGRIGLTLCPGKTQDDALTGRWARDLDLDAVRRWGAAVVVTLIEAHEIASLGIAALGKEVAARGMAWHHLPIRDYGVPDAAFEAAYHGIRDELRRRLAAGEAVLVHCKGGLGRAGTVAARLLVEGGDAPDAAIAAVRAARPGAIETGAQERYVRAPHPRGASAEVPRVVRASGA